MLIISQTMIKITKYNDSIHIMIQFNQHIDSLKCSDLKVCHKQRCEFICQISGLSLFLTKIL